MTEDERMDAELDELGYYTEDGTKYSGCCSAVIYDDSDLCSECKEHV